MIVRDVPEVFPARKRWEKDGVLAPSSRAPHLSELRRCFGVFVVMIAAFGVSAAPASRRLLPSVFCVISLQAAVSIATKSFTSHSAYRSRVSPERALAFASDFALVVVPSVALAVAFSEISNLKF
ncbi:MAG: hypothetical protein WBF14_14190, partial [Candidatus Acidiferrales bacterium]